MPSRTGSAGGGGYAPTTPPPLPEEEEYYAAPIPPPPTAVASEQYYAPAPSYPVYQVGEYSPDTNYTEITHQPITNTPSSTPTSVSYAPPPPPAVTQPAPRTGYGSSTSPMANTQPAMYSPPSGPVPKPASMYTPPSPTRPPMYTPPSGRVGQTDMYSPSAPSQTTMYQPPSGPVPKPASMYQPSSPPPPSTTRQGTSVPRKTSLPPPPRPVDYEGVISTEQALDPKLEWGMRLAALGLGAATKGAASRFNPEIEAALLGPGAMNSAGTVMGQASAAGTYSFEDIYGFPYPSTDQFTTWLNSVDGHGPGRRVTGPNGEPQVTRLPNSPTKNGTR